MSGSANRFVCKACGKAVGLTAPGTHHRNHCPYCLHSVHLDIQPGDRKSNCGGIMTPVGKVYKEDGEEVIIHKCNKCGTIRKNRIAGDDSISKVEKLGLYNLI